MKLRQLFKRCMIVILTLFIITTAWFCYLLYLGYEDSINSDIDEIETINVKDFDTIIFSAGKIGYQVEMSLDELSKLIKFQLNDITV